MSFPVERPRRLRRGEIMRSLVRETDHAPQRFVLPYFVREGDGGPQPIASMPGHFRLTVDQVLGEAEKALEDGVKSVLLFGIPEAKDAQGRGAWIEDGIVQRATAALKGRFGTDLLVMTDVCLCEYTDHGHCGVLGEEPALESGQDVLNDPSLELLARTAVSQAQAGADIVAPSDMMDGRVAAIRTALDAAGFERVAILSYAVKYASALYGPFRDAAGSAPSFGDRRSYQMDPANVREAQREALTDVAEGADMVMVKPALAYLDVIRAVRERVDVPVAAYQVSGEFALVKAAAERGWIDEDRAMAETLTAIRRAGADLVITYWAREAARRVRAGDLL